VADVFISYKSERRAAAQHLARILTLNGYSVWFDYGLFSGKDFGAQIERQIRTAKAVVVLWCGLSRDSPWVTEEAHLADKLGTFTPVWLERVDAPLGFARAHTIDLTGWDGGPRSVRLDPLLMEICRRVGRDPAPQFAGLQDYEHTWRSFGAPSLTRFLLSAPVAAFEVNRLEESTEAAVAPADPAPVQRPVTMHAATTLPPAAVPPSAAASPLVRDALRYVLAPLIMLLVAHYVIVNAFSLNNNYLRLISVLVPFGAGFALQLIGGRGATTAAAFAALLALAGATGMTISESLYSGDPMLPQTRFEWLDNLQFAATILLSFIAGHLAARISRALVKRKFGRA
jgi:TIR domain-containing protein